MAWFWISYIIYMSNNLRKCYTEVLVFGTIYRPKRRIKLGFNGERGPSYAIEHIHLFAKQISYGKNSLQLTFGSRRRLWGQFTQITFLWFIWGWKSSTSSLAVGRILKGLGNEWLKTTLFLLSQRFLMITQLSSILAWFKIHSILLKRWAMAFSHLWHLVFAQTSEEVGQFQTR